MSVLHSHLASWSFNGAARAKFWRKLAMQSRHGMDLEMAIRRLRDRARLRRSPVADVYTAILDNLATGHSLGTSLIGYAPDEEIMLINGGQRSGRLSECLLLAAELIEARRAIRGALRDALTYPAFLLCLIVVLLCVVSGFVVPRLVLILDPALWVGAARALYSISTFVTSVGGIFALAGGISGIWLIVYSLPRWTGRLRLTADHVAPWSIYRLTVGAVWLFTISTLMRAGIQIAHILSDMNAAETTTPWLRERVAAIRREYAHGSNFGEAMADAGTDFPDAELVEELRDYASLPGFHERLHDIARAWLTEGVSLIEQKARVLRTLCILLIVGIVCLLLLGLGSLQQQLSLAIGG